MSGSIYKSTPGWCNLCRTWIHIICRCLTFAHGNPGPLSWFVVITDPPQKTQKHTGPSWWIPEILHLTPTTPFYLLSPWMMFSSISVFAKFPNHYSNYIIQQPATSRNHLGNDLQTKNLRCRNSHPLGVRTVPRRWALWRRRQGQARPTTLHLSERRKYGRMATRTLANGMHAAEECIYKYYHMLSSYATYPYDCYDIRHMIKECNNCYGALKLRLKTYSQLTYIVMCLFVLSVSMIATKGPW